MLKDIGCCGAYCRTCREFTEGNCRGCRLGYEDGSRNIDRARCKIKICCFKERKLETCADCPDYDSCETIQSHFEKGYSYAKCRESIEFIRARGYNEFVKIADTWTNLYGKFE